MDQNSYIYSNEQKIIQIIDENNLDDDYDDLISVRVESDDEDDDEEEDDDGNYKLNISYERNLENMEEDNDTQDTIVYEIPTELVKESNDETLHAIEIRSKIIPVSTGNMIKLEKDGIKQEVDIRSISDNENSIELDDFTGFENNAHYAQKSSLSEILKFDTLNIKQEEPLNIDDVLFDTHSNSPIDIFEIMKTDDEDSQSETTQKEERLLSSSPIPPSSPIDLLSQPGPSSPIDLLSQPGPSSPIDLLSQPGPSSPIDLLTQPGPTSPIDLLTQPGPSSPKETPSSIETLSTIIDPSFSLVEPKSSFVEKSSIELPCSPKQSPPSPKQSPPSPIEPQLLTIDLSSSPIQPSSPIEPPSSPKELSALSGIKIEPTPENLGVSIEDIPLDEDMCDISLIMNDHSYLSQEQVNNIINNNSKNSNNISVNNNNDSLSIINLLNLINNKLSCTDNHTSTKNTESNKLDENGKSNLEISVNVISKLIESLAYNNNNNNINCEEDGFIDSSRNNININNFIKNIENNLNSLKKSYKVTECDIEVMNEDESGAPCVSNIDSNTNVLNNNYRVKDNNNKDEAEVSNGDNLKPYGQTDIDKSIDYDDDEHMVLRMDDDSSPPHDDNDAHDVGIPKPIDKGVKHLENEDLSIVNDDRANVELEKPVEEELVIQTTEEKYVEFEMLGKQILDTRVLWVNNLKDAEKSENINKEIANFIIEIRKELGAISQKYECSKEISCEQTTQTDEKVSIESAKKLNESYKRRHLASSSSDVSSDMLDSDEDFFLSKRRKKRTKKHHMKSDVKIDDKDDEGGDKANAVSTVVDEQNSDSFISVHQENSEQMEPEDKKEVDMSQIELDISEYLVRKPVDSSVLNIHETSKQTDQPIKKSIFDMPTQKFLIPEENDPESDTQIIESDRDSDHDEDDNIFDAATQVFVQKGKETTKQKKDDEDVLLDKEIDRATNFSNLDKKRLPSENHKTDREILKKKKKKDNLIDIIKEAEKKDDSDESSDNNEETMNDEQFLRNKNLETKWNLLNSSDTSDDSINSDDMEDIENYMRVSSDERSSDESSEVDKFLETMNNKTIENEIKKSIAQVESEAEKSHPSTTSETKESGIEDNKKKLDEQTQPNKADELHPVDKANDGGETSPDLDTEAFENFWKEHSTNHDEILDEAIASGDMNVEEVDNVNASNESAKQNNKQKSEPEEFSTDKDDVDENLLNCEVILTEGIEELQSKESETIAKKTKPKTKRDNLDKELFSKSLLVDDNDDSENEEVKEAKPDKKKPTDKDDTKSEPTSNAGDSDCEILDISMFQSKRKAKEPVDIETLLKASVKKSKTAVAGPTSSNSASGTHDNSKADDDCIYLSSDSDSSDLEEVVRDEEENDNDDSNATRKKPRAILTDDQLTVETKQAQKEESDRIKRLEKKHEIMSQRLSQMTQSQTESPESEIILDYDSKRKQNICVHPEIVKHLKPHQFDGVKFMYDSCYGSVDNIDKYPGSGCILAHCMGLGKTLQLIAVLHTLIRYPQLKTNRILVICPKSTVMNWSEEIQRWLGPIKTGPKLKVFHFPDNSDINDKMKILKEWHKCGTAGYTKSGCLLLGYEAFRTLVFYHLSKKKSINLGQSEIDSIKKIVNTTLLNPGADLIICDEGHVIKNKKSATNVSVSQVKTRRRVILTGTPIQNNLKEYYCMVNFIKPSFLGTEKEFANLYANPIKSGQHKDSSKSEIKFMKQRSFVLHKKLSKFVQRREAAVLKTFLPEKFEYVLFIPMTPIQEKLYEYFLENNSLKEKYGGKSLIPDYTFLRKIWTHPKVLENAWQNAVTKREKEKIRIRKIMNESDDDRPDDELDNQTGKMSVLSDWWRQHITQEDLESLFSSNKLRVMFEILKLCEENGEKCLIFSAFVAVLNAVEFFMQKIHNRDEATMHRYGLARFRGPWVLGQDYYRLDGKTPKTMRHAMITKFNSPENRRTKCFLISAKAGGQGINLIGANRVIILDTSWNPSNDQQNIFRIFRLGQKRPCFVYRILAMGTMEEKVYSRSVTKQAMSFRVVDEQQIDRHYSMAELAELYTLTKTDYTQRPVPIRPVDNLLSSLLHHFPDLVYKYHEHDSLLENKPEQDLSEADKAEAWAAYEKDVQRNVMLDPLNEMNMLNAQQNYRMGAAMGYPYGYNTKGMNFGILNNPNYANTLGSNFMSGFFPYQSLFSNMTDPNLMRMRQMYQNPYGNLNSPTGGQNSVMMDAFGGSGANALFGGNLINQSPYYKSLTPPIPPPPSTLRPKAGFNSMDDVANFLAVPSSNTPPPTPHSSTSVPVSSPLANPTPFNKEIDSSLFKQYFANPTLYNSPLGSSIAQSIPNSVSMPVASSGILSTTLSNLPNQTVTTKSLVNVQPSIPTSVITKPVGRPPVAKDVALPTLSSLISTNTPSSLNTNLGGRYSPQSHVIVKNKTQTPTSSVNILPPPTPAISTNSPTIINSSAAATLVKNYNMGIVYPKESTATNSNSPVASMLAVTKSPSSAINSAIKPHVIRKTNSTPINPIKSSVSTPNLTKAITSNAPTVGGLSKSNINTTTASTKKQQDDLVNLYMKKLHMMTSHLSTSTTTTLSSASRPILSNNSNNNINDSIKGKKSTNAYQLGNININELTKSSGLSITPVNTTKTIPTSAVQQIQTANLNKIPKGVTVKTLKLQKTSVPTVPPQTQSNKITGGGTSILHNATVTSNIGVGGGNKIIRRGGVPPQTVSSNTTIIPVPHQNLVTVPSNTAVSSGPLQKIIVSSNGSSSGINSGVRYVVTPTTSNASNTNQTKYVSLTQQQQHQGTGKTVPPLVLSRNSNNANIMKPIRLTETYGKKKIINASGNAITTTLPSVAPKQLANQTLVRALPQITGTKRKATDALNNHQLASASGSLTITESSKKPVTPTTKALIENSVKKVKSFDHLTIIPRNLQTMQQSSRSKQKDNVVDIVELE